MTEQYTVVTRKGQITIPVEIRRALGLQFGDRVAVSLDENGVLRATVRPVPSVAETTFGSITPRKRPEDMKELRELAQDEIADNAMREGRGCSKETI